VTERPLPPGFDEIARWARSRRLGYEARPDEAWFRRWEPHDNIAPPSRFINACTWVKPPGHVVLVEPWYAPDDGEPLERTVIAFAAHPIFMRRAAIRVGEHFLTRVAYLESAPPPQVKIGDRLWDENVTTFAASPREADAAFPPRLRRLLAGWGFRGHLEIRPAGLVLYCAGQAPTASDYDRLLWTVRQIVEAATAR
jgi:hypothetical protein